jgi:RNA polymerase sigma-70 factor (ECF subfamily)
MVDERREEEQVEAAVQLTEPVPYPQPNLEWLETIYRQHANAVIRAAYRITGNLADAEDVLQTVFFRLARRSEAPDLGDNALPYLRRAATNAALDLVQSRRVRSSSPLEVVREQQTERPGDAPERRHLARELRDRLREAVAGLHRRSAEMVILRFFEGLENREIAKIFNTSPGTVAVTLHRARMQLMNELHQYLGGIS